MPQSRQFRTTPGLPVDALRLPTGTEYIGHLLADLGSAQTAA